ncbi:BTAD domain-containing putative transcriptional regulator [Dactylosporangium sp. McL0621]|uniref:AfsR/SARP family transcriptional regulator n=1 Tax=Dactylosporangium sp. McL0621 TaxID=3415678 RepID=UPI003CEE05E5
MNEKSTPLLTFGILGPVEVRAGERRVAVNSAKQQALLGATLLQANAVVSTARLVDAIWGDEPPNTAPDLVQTYVSTLRRSIGRPAAACIVTRPPGYLMRVERGALDLHRFERLAAEAERAATGGDHERATRLLGDALAHWRGPALAGLDSPLFRAAAARLEELRLLATERRFESASHLGDPAWMVPELTAFVAEYPLREDMRALLMLVLYRLGRQADALRVYQQGYAVLREELGVEPGIGLRRAHKAILDGDGAPAADGPPVDVGAARTRGPDPAPRAEPAPGLPYQLPPPPARLVGRDAAERALGDALAAAAEGYRPTLVTVDGPAGVGKTALALAAAHRVRDRFPDGQLFVPFHATRPRPTSVDGALAMLLRSLGGPGTALPPSTDERAALLRSTLTERRILLLLDDVWLAAHVRPFLAAHPGCAVVVTCRRTLADLDADLRLSLAPLPPAQAVELLALAVGAARVAAEAGAADDIAAACEGLPLAVRAAAARLVARPGLDLAAFAARLADPDDRLEQLAAGDLDVRERIEGSLVRLDPDDRATLAQLAVSAQLAGAGAGQLAELTRDRIAGLLRQPVGDAERVADRLADARLLEHHGLGYRMPGLVRLVIERDLGSSR